MPRKVKAVPVEQTEKESYDRNEAKKNNRNRMIGRNRQIGLPVQLTKSE